jgi:hypothetical protein
MHILFFVNDRFFGCLGKGLSINPQPAALGTEEVSFSPMGPDFKGDSASGTDGGKFLL